MSDDAPQFKLLTMSEDGTKIKDTFMTLSQTAKKLGVRTYDYIRETYCRGFLL